MRKSLQIIAVSAGGLSILAATILGVIYFGDIVENTKNIVKKSRSYIRKISNAEQNM